MWYMEEYRWGTLLVQRQESVWILPSAFLIKACSPFLPPSLSFPFYPSLLFFLPSWISLDPFNVDNCSRERL